MSGEFGAESFRVLRLRVQGFGVWTWISGLRVELEGLGLL